MTDITPEQRAALNVVADGICDVVRDCGGTQGVPGGIIYAALMGKLSFSQYTSMMGILVRKGRLRKEGELYFAPERAAA